MEHCRFIPVSYTHLDVYKRQGKQPIVPVDGEEGLKDMVIIDAIFKAVKTGKKVMIKY